MVAVEHVLDLENAGNFDRHTSVLALSCNCWEAPSAKSDPGSSQAASRGVYQPIKHHTREITAKNGFFVHPDQHNGQNRGCGRFKP